MTAVAPQFRDLDIPQFTFLNNNNNKKSSNFNDHFSYKSQNGNYSRCNSNKPVFYMSNTNSRQNNKTQFCFDQFASNHANLNAKKQIDNSNWICYASTASESDGGSHASSELTGFRIVQSGGVVHDETEDDYDSLSESRSSSKSDESGVKFAASLMVIGPDVKEISLPSFA